MTKADVMLIEARLRQLAPRMSCKLIYLRGSHGTDFDNPIQFKFGSNTVTADIQAFEEWLDLLDTDLPVTPHSFMLDYLDPFLRKYAVD